MELSLGGYTFLIDDDTAHLALLPWRVRVAPVESAQPYAYFSRGRKYRWLHREVLGISHLDPKRVMADHVDGNTLDCRRSNLRVATPSQNQQNARKRRDNTSGHKGVSRVRSSGRWQAYIKVDGRQRGLGAYDRLEDAVAARKAAERASHGGFSRP